MMLTIWAPKVLCFSSSSLIVRHAAKHSRARLSSRSFTHLSTRNRGESWSSVISSSCCSESLHSSKSLSWNILSRLLDRKLRRRVFLQKTWWLAAAGAAFAVIAADRDEVSVEATWWGSCVRSLEVPHSS